MTKPFDRIITIDFETRWARSACEWAPQGYTLSKLTTEEYIRSPLFQDFGACLHEFGSDTPVRWVHHRFLKDVLDEYDWSRTAVMAHNAQFDVSILSWKYGHHPAFIFDTLSMARALRGVEVGNSLARLAEEFGLPAKGTAVYSTDGLWGIDRAIEEELAAYCKHDVALCEELFRVLSGERPAVTGVAFRKYPVSELKLIDLTLKMYTRPLLELDADMLQDALLEEREAREGLLLRLGVTDADLASNDKFAQMLVGLGVQPPMKKKKPTVKTPNPQGENFAFAKTDVMFQAMLNGSNADVADLCEARLKVKSTTERTRAQRFLDIAQRGNLPVPLSYYGAGPGRWTACLVADTAVIVYDRYIGQCCKRIVDVLPDDLVWDGIEFVPHEGVQFSGYKEVMTYDGVTGTPDHKVFIDGDTTVTLHEARESGARIMDAAKPDSRAVDRARGRFERPRR